MRQQTSPHHQRSDAILKSGINEAEFIEFFLGSGRYGINVAKVLRVVALKNATVTALPDSPPAVKGVIDLQGKPVLLVDLKSALHIPSTSQNTDRDLVLVTKFNQRAIGFLIDGVSNIHRTTWKDFEPVCINGFKDNEGGYTTGTIKLGGHIVIVLDLERMMQTYLPAVEERNLEAVSLDLQAKRSQLRIVYAEDSRMIRNITVKTLEKAGFANIRTFENGAEAHDFMRITHEEASKHSKSLRSMIDLVITDIEMPQMDGLTLCHEIKGGRLGTQVPPVLVYSSLISDEMSQRCAHVGADAQLSKPDAVDMVALIDKLCLAE